MGISPPKLYHSGKLPTKWSRSRREEGAFSQAAWRQRGEERGLRSRNLPSAVTTGGGHGRLACQAYPRIGVLRL